MEKTALIASACGGFILGLVGGWTVQLSILCTLIVIDYALGIGTALAGVSHKTGSGKLSSRAGLRGITKKVCLFVIVIVAGCIDALIGTDYVCEATTVALCINEIISILENLTLLGVKIPARLLDVIDKHAEHAPEKDKEGEKHDKA